MKEQRLERRGPAVWVRVVLGSSAVAVTIFLVDQALPLVASLPPWMDGPMVVAPLVGSALGGGFRWVRNPRRAAIVLALGATLMALGEFCPTPLRIAALLLAGVVTARVEGLVRRGLATLPEQRVGDVVQTAVLTGVGLFRISYVLLLVPLTGPFIALALALLASGVAVLAVPDPRASVTECSDRPRVGILAAGYVVGGAVMQGCIDSALSRNAQ